MINNKTEEQYIDLLQQTQDILGAFPKAKNGLPYLRMRNGKRVFFAVFLRKYHLDGSEPRKHQKRYGKKDMIGRMKLIPFFREFFTQKK